MKFGEEFRALRERKNKTQGDIAEVIGKSRMLVSGVETGKNNSFTDADIEKIICALGLDSQERYRLRTGAAKVQNKLPPHITNFLYENDDFLRTINEMAERKVGGNTLARIVNYMEEVLNVKND